MNDEDYKPPFPLTAKLNKLTIKVDRPQLSPEDVKKLDAAMREKRRRPTDLADDGASGGRLANKPDPSWERPPQGGLSCFIVINPALNQVDRTK